MPRDRRARARRSPRQVSAKRSAPLRHTARRRRERKRELGRSCLEGPQHAGCSCGRVRWHAGAVPSTIAPPSALPHPEAPAPPMQHHALRKRRWTPRVPRCPLLLRDRCRVRVPDQRRRARGARGNGACGRAEARSCPQRRARGRARSAGAAATDRATHDPDDGHGHQGARGGRERSASRAGDRGGRSRRCAGWRRCSPSGTGQ